MPARLHRCMHSPDFPLRGEHVIKRRTFLAGSASFVAAAFLSSCRIATAVSSAPKLSGYPFTLGIASGDPTPDSVVLWTRLAPRPLEVGGGMPASPVKVS